jgi:hypothetical protein
MSQESPVALLYDGNGNPLAVQNGVAIPANTSGLLSMGSDGADSRYMLVDANGRQIVVGAGTAGASVGGVVSIQGVGGGTAVPISGTVTATFASVGLNGAAAPGSSDQVGGSDGTNLQAERVFDLDTGVGTEWNFGVSVRLPGAGGSVPGGTAANPLRIDPTGTTTQPISAASLPLPTGAATEATLASRLADATFTARINTLGQKTSANSTPVVLASDQSAITVKQSTSATATRSDVAGSAASVTVLAANANRLGATIFNDSSALLYLKAGITASATDFTWKLFPGDLLTIDATLLYTGRIDGVWASATGAARVTEFTA